MLRSTIATFALFGAVQGTMVVATAAAQDNSTSVSVADPIILGAPETNVEPAPEHVHHVKHHHHHHPHHKGHRGRKAG